MFSDRIDSRRVSRIAAVLEKHLDLNLSEMDIYVNVAAGIRIDEVGIDLALAMALYSAKTNLTLPALSAVLGEVSLAGEIRGVTHIERRVKSARDMDFRGSSVQGPLRPTAMPANVRKPTLKSETSKRPFAFASGVEVPYWTAVATHRSSSASHRSSSASRRGR